MAAGTTSNLQTTQKRYNQTLPVPSRVGRYEILAHIGRGGMGDVYKAKHMGLDRLVALKVLTKQLSSPEFQERFNAEAQAVSKLQHQNIVTLYDYGEVDNREFIAMQFIQGTTLAELIKKEKKFSYGRIVKFSKQICRGLKYAHDQNVIHRDIKPSNIMVSQNDTAILSDFGLAYITGNARLTTTGMAMGTPEYMAPEQCEGKPLDNQCDIYSLGVLMYEMVCGRPPFLGENPISIAYRHVHDVPTLISKLRTGVPPTFELIITKCLKKNKNERYRNADELLKDLDAVKLDSLVKQKVHRKPHYRENQLEKRITERRGLDRRSQRKKRKFHVLTVLSSAIFLLAAIFLTTKFLSFTNKTGGAQWIRPDQVKFLSSGTNSARFGQLKAAFDGKLTTGWTLPLAEKQSCTLQAIFKNPRLIQGISIHATPSGKKKGCHCGRHSNWKSGALPGKQENKSIFPDKQHISPIFGNTVFYHRQPRIVFYSKWKLPQSCKYPYKRYPLSWHGL